MQVCGLLSAVFFTRLVGFVLPLMLRRSVVQFAKGSRPMPVFGLFMREMSNHPEVVAANKGGVKERSAVLGRLYRELSPADKDALTARAAQMTVATGTKAKRVVRTRSASEGTKREAPPFALFMKNNYDKVRHLPHKERVKALGALYKASPGESGA
jgi:hypothetical protein